MQYFVIAKTLVRIRENYLSILSLSLARCIIIGKSLNLSEPRVPFLWNGDNNRTIYLNGRGEEMIWDDLCSVLRDRDMVSAQSLLGSLIIVTIIIEGACPWPFSLTPSLPYGSRKINKTIAFPWGACSPLGKRSLSMNHGNACIKTTASHEWSRSGCCWVEKKRENRTILAPMGHHPLEHT